jgi:hypothetical protein
MNTQALKRFVSGPDAEYRFCAECFKRGYEFDYCWHPINAEEWPVVNGRLWFGRCRACANDRAAGKTGIVTNDWQEAA